LAVKNFWGQNVDFWRITLFCLEKRLSRHKMTIFSKNVGRHGPFGFPGYAYAREFRKTLHRSTVFICGHRQIHFNKKSSEKVLLSFDEFQARTLV